MKPKPYIYRTNCVIITAADILAMLDVERSVTLETIRKNCEGVEDFEREHGYAVGAERGLHMKDDGCVSYHKSKFKGLPCYFIKWSAIEFIWTKGDGP